MGSSRGPLPAVAGGQSRPRRKGWSAPSVLSAALLLGLAGCAAKLPLPTHPELLAADDDPLALCDALESLIAAGRDTKADRAYAYAVVQDADADDAGSAFGRAAVTGRFVQGKGLRAADSLREVEEYARRSAELDPNFRDGAATRLLGTLYVVAPASLLDHGDSETGLAMLESLTAAHPQDPVNHLRLAEAYITLHDPEPARRHLCFCLDHQMALRPDDQKLLAALIAEAGQPSCSPG